MQLQRPLYYEQNIGFELNTNGTAPYITIRDKRG